MLTKPLQILLIDDARFILERLSALIREYMPEASVQEALSAEQGMDFFRDSWPDILVLDISLPGMSGIEMLRRVRRQSKVKPVIIMLTNNTLPDYREACLDLGADYFLDKSRDFLMLTRVIEEIIKLRFSDE